MDDSCAVCAESLSWVAYGPCGHREVCSTCVVRLRFVLEDRRCCICKVESPVVFVTKAMGDFTKAITDFSTFSFKENEGQRGEYWYHEDSQAYFDDVDQYKIIKAMCRLSCSICDKNVYDKGGGDAWNRRNGFRSIEQLKGHLFHRHALFMCSLCLEGRKVFISEQKLYSRGQLRQHINTGDSEVDGSTNERGGFKGHPSCEFCKNPFYGDNELYMHMSRDHETCYICQRKNPGQYDYFKNYDDLENHFRGDHFLCEHEACLSKKFIVFLSESDLKRHNTKEHGGNMSRSQRNAALQIPTSFRYRQREIQEQRRGRGVYFHSDNSGDQLSAAIQASMETAFMDNRHRESFSDVSTTQGTDAVARCLDSLNITSDNTTESPSRRSENTRLSVLENSYFPALSETRRPLESSSGFYAQAVGASGSQSKLAHESFPPLSGVSMDDTKKQPTKYGGGSSSNTFAEHVVSKGMSHKTPFHASTAQSGNSNSARFSENKPQFHQVDNNPFPSLPTSVKPVKKNRNLSSKSNKIDVLSHSSSAPNLIERNNFPASSSNNPSKYNYVKKLQSEKQQVIKTVEDVQTANKSLVERIRIGLESDDKFADFKGISGKYRQGLIDTATYLSYVQQFGLSHLTIELASLCPDPLKQKELIDTYNANITLTPVIRTSKQKKKGKTIESSSSNIIKKEDTFLSTVKKLQKSQRSQEEDEVEILSKDGYRTSNKGKLNLNGQEINSCSNGTSKQKKKGKTIESSSSNIIKKEDTFLSTVKRLQKSQMSQEEDEVEILSKDGYRTSNKGKLNLSGQEINSCSNGTIRQKKIPKFQRVRLGDGSLYDLDQRISRFDDHDILNSGSNSQSGGGSQLKGAWKKGGVEKLFL